VCVCVRVWLWLYNISVNLKGKNFTGLEIVRNSGAFWPSEPLWHHKKGFPSCIKCYDFREESKMLQMLLLCS